LQDKVVKVVTTISREHRQEDVTLKHLLNNFGSDNELFIPAKEITFLALCVSLSAG